mgnify:FL=1
MSKIALTPNASGTGVFTISSPATNTDRSLTLPDEAGTVLTSASPVVLPKGGPTFRTRMSVPQTISLYTWTKLQFSIEIFDTNSSYDTSTYRFTPNIAGYYLITGNVYVTAVAQLGIFKNGIEDVNGTYESATGFSVIGLNYLNGTTDYIELYMFTEGATINTSSTQFCGTLVRAA